MSGPQGAAPPAAGGAAAVPTAPDVMFDTLGLHPDLLRGIVELGFTRATPVQAKTIPAVLAGRDVLACAPTGTGKTAAFVLPILHRFMQRKGSGRVRALIVAPTRELALQSIQHLRALARYVPLTGVAIFGGVPMEPQISALAKGIDIISATPGRLLDHVYSGRIDFGELEVLVLDEADRMLDMGFLPDVQHILRLLPPKRQNLLFSATMPSAMSSLVQELLHNPVSVQVGAKSASAAGIRDAVYAVPKRLKTELLVWLLRQQTIESALVFARTKIGAGRLSDALKRHGFRVSVLHGDRSQSQRLHALEQFRHGRNQVMVATDIAARGIDIEDISHVINFDVPETPEAYIHRVGRTARADATGDALTFVADEEEFLMRDIERTLGRQVPRLATPPLGSGESRAEHGRPGGHAAGRPGRPGGAHPGGQHPGGHRAGQSSQGRRRRPHRGGGGAGRPVHR